MPLELKIVPISSQKYLEELGFISSSQKKKDNDYQPLFDEGSIMRNLPSLLYGNSFIQLLVQGDNSEKNRFYFGYAPSPFFRGSLDTRNFREAQGSSLNQYLGRLLD